MPTVPAYFSNGGAASFRADHTTWTVELIRAEAPPDILGAARLYPNNGAFYPRTSGGSTVTNTRRIITPKADTGGVSMLPADPLPDVGYFGTIIYPDTEDWHGHRTRVDYVRNISFGNSSKLRGSASIAAPRMWLHEARRDGRKYEFDLSIETQGGALDEPSRLQQIQYQMGGVIHTLSPSSVNFPAQGQEWEWGGFTSKGTITLHYSGNDDNDWGEVKFRAVDFFGQIGGWLHCRIPPRAEYSVDSSQNPLFKIDATASYDVDGEVVEYSIDMQNWQTSPILTADFTVEADQYTEDFTVPFEVFLRDSQNLYTRSGAVEFNVQARTPRFDSIATGANTIYRARQTVQPFFPYALRGVLFERRQTPASGWQYRAYLEEHVDPSLTIDRATGDIYLMARDMVADQHRLYRSTDGEFLLEHSMDPPWGEGFSGGRILHVGGGGFRAAALKRLAGGDVEVWVRGSADGVNWPGEAATAPEQLPFKPVRIHTFEADSDGANPAGKMINLSKLQDGSGTLFLDNGLSWLRKSTNGRDWSEFTP